MIGLNNPRDWDNVKLGVDFEFISSGKGVSFGFVKDRSMGDR